MARTRYDFVSAYTRAVVSYDRLAPLQGVWLVKQR